MDRRASERVTIAGRSERKGLGQWKEGGWEKVTAEVLGRSVAAGSERKGWEECGQGARRVRDGSIHKASVVRAKRNG